MVKSDRPRKFERIGLDRSASPEPEESAVSKIAELDSAVVAVAEPHPVVDLEPLDANALHTPLDVRVIEMIRRSDAGDALATLALAESILLELPTHGLAAACHADAASKLKALFEATPRPPPLLAALDMHARLLLARTDGRATIASMLPAGAARASTLRALHDLVRLGLVEGSGADPFGGGEG